MTGIENERNTTVQFVKRKQPKFGLLKDWIKDKFTFVLQFVHE